MKWLMCFSLALNLLLAVVWARLDATTISAASPTPGLVRQVQSPQPEAPAPEVSTNISPFSWSSLESEDYLVYKENLRRIGCPEQTIRDILEADVRENYGRKVYELVQNETLRFWDLLSNREEFEAVVNEKGKQLQLLDDERDALVETLFGSPNSLNELQNLQSELSQQAENEVVLDFLPDEKRLQVKQVQNDFRIMREQMTNAPPSAFKDLGEQEQAALSKVLTPDELSEYNLRKSPYAARFANLRGFAATEAEIKSMVSIWDRYATEVQQAAILSAPTNRAALNAAAEAEREAALSQLLGERVGDLKKAEDHRFQTAQEFVRRAGLSTEVADSLYFIRKQYDEAQQQLHRNYELSPETRDQMLRQLQASANQNVSRLLGSKMELYMDKQGRDWMPEF